MANWNRPTPDSLYLDFVVEMNDKFKDVATQFGVQAAQNYPVGTMRFNRSANYFDEFDGATFVPKILSVAGGGTGTNNVNQIRINLGLGSMSTQNSNAVAITGGTITGVAYSANDITGGILALARGGTGQAMSLTPYGTIMLSDGGRLVLASGQYISELNASALVIGTVPLARLSGVATGPGPNTFTGTNNFTGGTGPQGPIFVSSTFAAYQSYDTGGPADGHYTRFGGTAGGFIIQRVNDPYSVAYNLLSIDANGWMTGIGVGLTNLNGSNIDRGRVAPQFLGGGSPNAGNFLRGDGNWVEMGTGGGGEAIPAGMIGIFYISCPAGWTRVPALDGRFPLGATSYGTAGGSDSHTHGVGLNTSDAGGHDHGIQVRATATQSGNLGNNYAQMNGSFPVINWDHQHAVSWDGRTDGTGNHSHQLNGSTGVGGNMPYYLTVVFCAK